jgi:peptide/nickel transport system substrate-binding protein
MLDAIELRFYSDDAALLSALTEQEIHGALFRPGLDGRAVKAIDEESGLIRRSLHGTAYSLVYLNQLIPVFQDDRVRRGLQHALDRQSLVDAVFEGQALPLDSPIAPGLWSHIASEGAYQYDPDVAGSLLDQAGWPLDGDIRRNTEGDPLSFNLEASDDPVQVVVAQELARQWRELGVQVNVLVSGASQFVEGVLLPRRFHSALVSIDPGPDPDPYPFWHGAQAIGDGRNLASFIDGHVDDLLENARLASSPAERAAAYREFQQLFAQLSPAVLLYTPEYQYVVASDLRGTSPGLLASPASRFRDVHRWFTETARSDEDD